MCWMCPEWHSWKFLDTLFPSQDGTWSWRDGLLAGCVLDRTGTVLTVLRDTSSQGCFNCIYIIGLTRRSVSTRGLLQWLWSSALLVGQLPQISKWHEGSCWGQDQRGGLGQFLLDIRMRTIYAVSVVLGETAWVPDRVLGERVWLKLQPLEGLD